MAAAEFCLDVRGLSTSCLRALATSTDPLGGTLPQLQGVQHATSYISYCCIIGASIYEPVMWIAVTLLLRVRSKDISESHQSVHATARQGSRAITR